MTSDEDDDNDDGGGDDVVWLCYLRLLSVHPILHVRVQPSWLRKELKEKEMRSAKERSNS